MEYRSRGRRWVWLAVLGLSLAAASRPQAQNTDQADQQKSDKPTTKPGRPAGTPGAATPAPAAAPPPRPKFGSPSTLGGKPSTASPITAARATTIRRIGISVFKGGAGADLTAGRLASTSLETSFLSESPGLFPTGNTEGADYLVSGTVYVQGPFVIVEGTLKLSQTSEVISTHIAGARIVQGWEMAVRGATRDLEALLAKDIANTR